MDRPFAVPIDLPRGPEHYWAIMRELSPKGFTVGDVAGCTNGVAYKTVKGYVRALLKQKAIEKIGVRPVKNIEDANLYRVVSNRRTAPVERRDGYTGERGKVQSRLWATMRRMREFTIAELCFTAQASDMVIKPHTAEKYVRALAHAGIVMVVEPYRKGAKGRPGARAGRYMLRPKMNTGPKPPRVFKATIVFDSNKQKIVGNAEASEVSL